jgi:hypothetical protein
MQLSGEGVRGALSAPDPLTARTISDEGGELASLRRPGTAGVLALLFWHKGTGLLDSVAARRYRLARLRARRIDPSAHRRFIDSAIRRRRSGVHAPPRLLRAFVCVDAARPS